MENQEKTRILIVDGYIDLAERMADLLDCKGFKCDTSDNVNDAFRMLITNPDYKAVITVIRLPMNEGEELEHQNGFAFLKSIKHAYQIITAQVIALTSRTDEDYWEKVKESGANVVLERQPVMTDELVKTLRDLGVTA